MRNDKIRELIQSKDKAERVLGVQMLCHVPFEDAVHTLYGFDMSSKISHIIGHNTPQMILHACFQIIGLNGWEYYGSTQLLAYLSAAIQTKSKETPWLGLLDLKQLMAYREMIEPFGIESSIDEWENDFDSGRT